MIDREQRIRRSPRVSANALAQYLSASASRREAILRAQKFPPEFKTTWYKEASEAIVKYLIDPERNVDIVVRAIDRIQSAAADSQEGRRQRTNAEALDAFLRGGDDIVVDQLVAAHGPRAAAVLIEGVTISVRPEVSLVGSYRGRCVRGGVRLYFSKSDRLTIDAAASIAALIHRHLAQHGNADFVVSRRHCQVIDVFAGEVHAAPTAITRRMKEIEAACREIALHWPSIGRRKR